MNFPRPRHRSRLGRRFLRTGLVLLGCCVSASIFAILALRWLPPPISAMMQQQVLAARLRGDATFRLRYQWVAIERISPQAALAVVAAEDQKFPHHSGFDFASISQAWRDNRHRHRPRGASTITQQVAKNLFLWPGRSYLRKGLEAYWTVLLELLWPKRRILETYLNLAEFGSGVYGVEAASRLYFDKSAARLCATEAAALAAVLPSPRTMSPARPSPYARQRSRQIQQQMRNLGGTDFLRDVLTEVR
ncbi:MAG: monofunctional biosynthetic peptidoglycan transglycosylase [Thermodesulfobacteriota bacterium]